MGNNCAHHPSEDSDSDSEDGLSEVTLNIYDVSRNDKISRVNDVLHKLGTGIFHAAVEVYGLEWSYGKAKGNGIFSCKPAGCKAHNYRESLSMGRTSFNYSQVAALLAEMKAEWPGPEYDLLRNNCTHFARAFCGRLGVSPVPRWVTNLGAAGAHVQEGVVVIKHVASAPFVIAKAKAHDIDANVHDIIEAGRIRRDAPADERKKHHHFRDFTQGLVALAKEAKHEDIKDRYRPGDLARGVVVAVRSGRHPAEDLESENAKIVSMPRA